MNNEVNCQGVPDGQTRSLTTMNFDDFNQKIKKLRLADGRSLTWPPINDGGGFGVSHLCGRMGERTEPPKAEIPN